MNNSNNGYKSAENESGICISTSTAPKGNQKKEFSVATESCILHAYLDSIQIYLFLFSVLPLITWVMLFFIL